MAPPESADCGGAWADEMERTEAEVAEAVRQQMEVSVQVPVEVSRHVVLKEIYVYCATIRAFLASDSREMVPCLSTEPHDAALWEYDTTFRSLRNLYTECYLGHKGILSRSDPARVTWGMGQRGSLSMLETALVRDDDGYIVEKEMPMFVSLDRFGCVRLTPNPKRALCFTTRVEFTGAVRHSHPKRGQVKLYNEDGSVDILRHKRGAVYVDGVQEEPCGCRVDHGPSQTSLVRGKQNYVAKYVCPRRNGS